MGLSPRAGGLGDPPTRDLGVPPRHCGEPLEVLGTPPQITVPLRGGIYGVSVGTTDVTPLGMGRWAPGIAWGVLGTSPGILGTPWGPPGGFGDPP